VAINCGSFGVYPSFVAGILNSVKINLYVLCNKTLHYANYIEKCILGKQCTISFKSRAEDYFHLSSGEETIVITSESRFIRGKRPSKLMFAYAVLNRILLSSLTYGILCTNNRANYITNEVLTSRHDSVFEKYTCYFDMPKRLANSKLYIEYCKADSYKKCPFYILYCTKKSHRIFENTQCHCKMCVKTGPDCLRSERVNKLRVSAYICQT